MNNELLKFFFEKGLLVDKEVLDLFQDVNDSESVKIIIEKIKNRHLIFYTFTAS